MLKFILLYAYVYQVRVNIRSLFGSWSILFSSKNPKKKTNSKLFCFDRILECWRLRQKGIRIKSDFFISFLVKFFTFAFFLFFLLLLSWGLQTSRMFFFEWFMSFIIVYKNIYCGSFLFHTPNWKVVSRMMFVLLDNNFERWVCPLIINSCV